MQEFAVPGLAASASTPPGFHPMAHGSRTFLTRTQREELRRTHVPAPAPSWSSRAAGTNRRGRPTARLSTIERLRLLSSFKVNVRMTPELTVGGPVVWLDGKDESSTMAGAAAANYDIVERQRFCDYPTGGGSVPRETSASRLDGRGCTPADETVTRSAVLYLVAEVEDLAELFFDLRNADLSPAIERGQRRPEFSSPASASRSSSMELAVVACAPRDPFAAGGPHRGVERGPAWSFTSFTQAPEKNGLSCILVGFHFRNAAEQGTRHGRAIGNHVFNCPPPIEGR